MCIRILFMLLRNGPLLWETGHFNYYGVIGNSRMLSQFFNAARHTIYSVLNSRSQKKSYNWEGFKAMWKTLDIPNPKILETYAPPQRCFL
jgi:hypothetical protein